MVIDGITMKGRRIIIPASLQERALDQLQINYMGIEKTSVLMCKYIYGINDNVDLENVIKNFPVYHSFQVTQPKDKMLSHKILGRLWEWVGGGILSINNKYDVCIVEYYSRFPVMKQIEGFTTDNLIKTCKLFFAKYRLPSKQFFFREVSRFLQVAKLPSCGVIIIC